MKRHALVVAVCLAAGCAHAPGPAGEGRSALLEVPFFPDHTDQCGPSALASILSYWGRRVEPRDLKKELYFARLKGSLPMDLYLAARAQGLPAQMAEGSLDRLKVEVDAGRPAIVFINMGYAIYPIGHYLVVTGYDDGRRGLYAHSGIGRNAFMSYRRFERRWEKTGRWTLLVSRPRS